MPAFSTLCKLITLSLIADITWSATNIISCAMNGCRNTTINCVHDQNCLVSCSSANGCENSIIHCPPHQECIVLCDDIESCKGSTINGSHSSLLNINGCIQDESCLNLNIYCPQNIPRDVDKNCRFKGNDNLGASITIHAVYGWNQIKIEYEGTSTHNLHGTLYCNAGYDTSCDIASHNWTCADAEDRCNDILYSIQTTKDDSETETDADADTGAFIETEMLIIVATMIAAFCFISLCCWLNRYKKEQKPSTNQVKTTATVTRHKGEEAQHHAPPSQPTNKTAPKHRTKSEPIRTKRPAAAPEHRSRRSTGPRGSKKGPRTPKKKKRKKHALSTPPQYLPPKAITTPAQENKAEARSIDMGAIGEKETEAETQKVNDKTVKSNARYKATEYENDLAVITESKPIETNPEQLYHAKPKKRLQFRPDASDSDTLNTKADTWDNYDQENGILADRRDMNQMMGFLEDDMIACSYE